MPVSVNEFHTYAVHISHYVKDSDERIADDWTASEVFNPLHFINGSRYFKDDNRSPSILGDSNERQLMKCDIVRR